MRIPRQDPHLLKSGQGDRSALSKRTGHVSLAGPTIVVAPSKISIVLAGLPKMSHIDCVRYRSYRLSVYLCAGDVNAKGAHLDGAVINSMKPLRFGKKSAG